MPIVALEDIARSPDHRPVRSVTFQWSAWVWWSRSGVSFRLRCPRSGAAKSAEGKVFRRDQITKSRARAAIIMVPPPGLDRPPSLGDGPEPVDVQTFVAQRPVERLDVDVIPWFPGREKSIAISRRQGVQCCCICPTALRPAGAPRFYCHFIPTFKTH